MNTYPKIDTLFKRDDSHQITNEYRRPVVATISQWVGTEKVDGTNIRIHSGEDGSIDIGGRTDNAQLPVPLVAHLQELRPALELNFKGIKADHGLSTITLFGEGYGPKIQGGGNYRDDQGFILFDVQVDGRAWLNDLAVSETAARLNIPRVPVLGVLGLDEWIDMARDGFESRCSVRPRPAEGVVCRPIEPLYDQRGSRIIVKIKTKDFR